MQEPLEVVTPASFPTGGPRSSVSLASSGRRPTVAQVEGTATEKGLLVNIVTGGLGTGILCLPWLTAGAALVPGLIITAGVLVVNAWTICMLVRAVDKYQAFDFGALLSKLPGRLGFYAQIATNFIVWASTFMCLVGYVIVISDSVILVLPFHVQRCVVVMVSAAVVCPLCFLDQANLAFTSIITVGAFCYIFLLLGYELTFTGAHSDSCFMGLGRGSSAMVGGMANCVIIQMCMPSMYGELMDRTVEKMDRVVTRAFVALFLLYSSFGCGGYLCWGSAVSDNVLQNLGSNSIAKKVGQLGAAVAVMGVYPILVGPMVAPLKNAPNLQRYCTPAVLAIVAGSGGCAIFMKSLGSLSVINGAICAGIFVGLLPALVGHFLLDRPAWQMEILVAAGAVASVLGIVFRDNYSDELKCLA